MVDFWYAFLRFSGLAGYYLGVGSSLVIFYVGLFVGLFVGLLWPYCVRFYKGVLCHFQ